MSQHLSPVNALVAKAGAVIASFLNSSTRLNDAGTARGAEALRPVRHSNQFAVDPARAGGDCIGEEAVHATTFHTPQHLTCDAVPVTVVATVTWTRAHMQGRSEVGRDRQDVVAAGRAALQVAITTTGFAELLSERSTFEAGLCRALTPVLAERGLAVQATFLREVCILGPAPAECDARQLRAMRECLSRHRSAKVIGTS